MATLSCYNLFLYLLLSGNLIVFGKANQHDSSVTKQTSKEKITICQLNLRLNQTTNELNQLKKDLNATRFSLYAIKNQLEKHIVLGQRDHETLFKMQDQAFAKHNDQMRTTAIGGASERPRDCSDIRALGRNVTGIYRVYPGIQETRVGMDVYCDFSSVKDSWLVFQRRKDGSEKFDRLYRDYERGFGNLTGEFWLGNEKLHLLTSTRKYKLRIDIGDFQGSKRYAEYSIFSVESAANSYRLTVGGYSGNAGDGLAYHNGMKFTAKDVDNDPLPGINCAKILRGGWWYNKCHASNLNGVYLGGSHSAYGTGVVWDNWHGFFYSLKSTEMKITSK